MIPLLIYERDQGVVGTLEDDQEWLRSQLDHKSFADQTLPFLLLSELDDQRERAVERSGENERNDDSIKVKEDNHMNDDQDQEAGESGTKNFADDTTTSTAGEGEAGTEDILHGHEGVVEAGDNPDNQVVSTRLISGLSVPIDGTTLYHEGVYQPKSSSQEGQFVYDDDVMRTAGGYATGTSDMGEECCVVVQL